MDSFLPDKYKEIRKPPFHEQRCKNLQQETKQMEANNGWTIVVHRNKVGRPRWTGLRWHQTKQNKTKHWNNYSSDTKKLRKKSNMVIVKQASKTTWQVREQFLMTVFSEQGWRRRVCWSDKDGNQTVDDHSSWWRAGCYLARGRRKTDTTINIA